MSRGVDRFVGFDFSNVDKADFAGTLREAGALGIGNQTGTFGSALSYVNAANLSDPMDAGRVYEIAKKFVGQRIQELRNEERDLSKETDDLRNKAAILGEAGKCVQPWKLSVPDGSSFHSAIEAVKTGRAYAFDENWKSRNGSLTLAPGWETNLHIFLVEHDWAKAFEKSDVDDGEIRLPFEQCVFEFILNGVRVCVWCESEDGTKSVFIKAGKNWGVVREDGMWPYLTKTIRCICIALDAAVAKTEVVRAPHKLNHAREKQGKLPIFDHHVVSLMRRDRPDRLDGGGETGTRKRLHWRRGHWRHYENHKTWVNWMLVGDPDLGFVDKHYRL